MSPQLQNVNDVVKQVRTRIRMRNTLRGAAITLAVAAVSLLIVALVAGLLKQKPGVLIVLRLVPVLLTTAAAWLFLIRPLRTKIDDVKIARLIEEKCALGDRVVTAVEYSEGPREASPAIVDRLIDDASRRSSSIELNQVIDRRHAYAYGAAAALILFGLIGALVLGPRSVSSGLAALYSTDDSSVAASSMFISVSPGTTKVPRGSDLKIKATLSGFDSVIAQMFMRKVGADNWVAQTMEPAKNSGEFQFVIFNIQDSAGYYVEAKDIRSPEFALEVVDLPFVKQIDLVLDFPAYTHLASKKIENGGEVAALKGTVVQVAAQLSASAKAARIVISDGTKVEMTPAADNHFIGQFTVKQNGTYRIELTSEGGERYNGSNEYDITVLEDHGPTVLIDKPGRDMKVTSIQEIFTQVRAEDDYGVSSIELYYSVNGGEEKKVQLQDLKSDAAHTLSGAHTFFLEEYGLQPGDFISYYAKARDNSATPQESTSDIYFMEVRPFDREFRQAQQQGQGGGDQDSNALTRRQREIIAATFRVQREVSTYTPQDKDENFGAVTLSQEKLKTDAETLAERIRRRLGDKLNSEPDFAKLVEYLAQAAKEMGSALDELRAKKAKEALQPEQRALQQLLRAEAIFRDIQVARGGGQGQSSGQQNEELADLFELQLDKMKNQYETVQSHQQQNQNQQQDEIARRLAELARRQQQQVEQRMRSQTQQQGGGGGGSQRQQQEMIDEAQKMARELERLSRDRRDPKLAEAAQQMQQAADELRRAQASQSQSSSSSQGGTQATADQLRALQRMEQARRTLESAQQAGGQQGVQRLRQQAEEALKRQEEISRKVDELARNPQGGGASEEKKQQVAERKQALADQVAGLERDIDQTARGMGQDRQQASDKLREAAGAIRQNRIPDRIRQNQQMIANGWYDQARERERIIKGNLEEVLKDIQAAEGGATRKAQGESIEDALNRARELADNLESLRRRMESGEQQGQDQSGQQQGQQGNQSGQQQAQNGQQSQSQGGRHQQRGQQAGGQQNQQGQQAGSQSGQQNQQGQQSGSQSGQQARGQQSGRQRGQNQQARGQQNQSGQQQGQQGQQQGQQGQSGQQGGQQQGQQGSQQGQQSGQQGQQGQQGSQQGQGQQANQQGGRPTNGGVDPRMGGGPPRGGQRQLESELRQRLADAEELKRALGRNSDLARDLNRAMDQLRHINPNAFADPSQLALLKNEVIYPLRQLEIELARRLQAKLGNNGPGAFGDGDAPDRYRKMIEEYYRRLSARSPQQKP